MKFEQQPSNPEYFIEDYVSYGYYPLLLKLPPELRLKHIAFIEREEMGEEEAESYLKDILEKRSEALTETVISDPKIEKIISTVEELKKLVALLESSIFQSLTIGEGYTAKIKSFNLPSEDKHFPLAIKYLLTPTPKTLSVSGEHDMLHEVERMHTLEIIEEQVHSSHIRIPHPYFYHRSEKVQCLAMERVDGFDLLQFLEGKADEEFLQDLVKNLGDVLEESIHSEFNKFFEAMHTYCLHGDIKPANFMIDRKGNFYVIDFGQSVLVNDIDEAGRSQLDNLKELEHSETKTIITLFFKKLLEYKKSL